MSFRVVSVGQWEWGSTCIFWCVGVDLAVGRCPREFSVSFFDFWWCLPANSTEEGEYIGGAVFYTNDGNRYFCYLVQVLEVNVGRDNAFYAGAE